MSNILFDQEDFERIFGKPKVHIKPDPLVRNAVLEEVAREFEKMPFGDTSASFAAYVRSMKNNATS